MGQITASINGRQFAIEHEIVYPHHAAFIKAVTYRVDDAVVSPTQFEEALVAALIAENRPLFEARALARQIIEESAGP